MKKLIYISISCLMLMFSTVVSAQTGTSISDAFALADAGNTCTFAKGEDYTSARYFAYTATERGLLTIEGESSSASYAAYDASNAEVSTVNRGSSLIVPMTEGSTVYVQVTPNMTLENETIINFHASFRANPNACLGIKTGEPIVISLGQENVTVDTAPGFEEFNSYLTYTATATGMLRLTCSGYVLTGRYGSSFDNLDGTFSVSYENGGYVGSLPVNEGETVCISIGAYTSMTVSAQITYQDKGTSPNYPIDIVEGQNEVSAEFGEYWYKYAGATEEGYISITSGYTIPRGHVCIYAANNTYSPLAQSETGYYDIRFKVSANTPYLVYIYKTEESDDWPNPDTFNFSFTPLQQGESASNPLPLTDGQEVTLNALTGTFYYLLNVPEATDLKMIDIKVAGEAADGCGLRLYDISEGMYYSATGTLNVKKEARGTAYMLIVEKNKAGEAVISPAIRGLLEGESINLPIQLAIGTNNIAKASDVYYMYTATLDGRISLSVDIPSVGMEFPVSADPTGGVYAVILDAGSTKLDVVKGRTYIVHLSNVHEDCTLTLAENEYKAGDTKELALEVQGSKVDLTEGMTNVWFRYTVEKAGKMTISSNMPGDGNSSLYYSVDNEQYLSYIINSDEDGNIFYNTSFSVSEGQTIYVRLVSSADRTGNSIHFTLSDFAEGESLATAYKLVPNGNTVSIPAATRTQSQWLKVRTDGHRRIVITTDRFISGGIYLDKDTNRNYDIEFVADGNNEVHTAVYESAEPVEYLYIQVTFSYGRIVVKAEGSTPVAVEGITATSPSETYSINGIRTSHAGRGISIIRQADGKVTKVIR